MESIIFTREVEQKIEFTVDLPLVDIPNWICYAQNAEVSSHLISYWNEKRQTVPRLVGLSQLTSNCPYNRVSGFLASHMMDNKIYFYRHIIFFPNFCVSIIYSCIIELSNSILNIGHQL